MSLSPTVSAIDGDFSRKSQNFPTTFVFCAPAEGVPLELDIGIGADTVLKLGAQTSARSTVIF